MRTNHKQLSVLVSLFKSLFPNEPSTYKEVLDKEIETTVKSIDPEIYHVVFGCYANNCWSVYFAYKNSEQFICVDLNEIKENKQQWLTDLKNEVQLRVIGIENTLKCLEEKEESEKLENWFATDLKPIYKKQRELQKATGKEKEFSQIKQKARQMREDIWEIEDLITENKGNNKLSDLIKKYEVDFPFTVKKVCESIVC